MDEIEQNCDLSAPSRSIICFGLRLWQIVDLLDTDKSQYFGINKFNDCFIIWLLSLFSYLNHSLSAQGSHLPLFKQQGGYNIMYEKNIICSKKNLDDTSHEQTIICMPLFAVHMLGSRPMKRKEKCIDW